jgi:hypothetical protein
MHVTRFNEAPAYFPPEHFDMRCLRLQGHEAGPATQLWIDPTPLMGAPPSGASFALKGVSSDVGVAISSAYPSLIPVATTNGGTWTTNQSSGVSTFNPTPQTFIDLVSSQTLPLKLGWL